MYLIVLYYYVVLLMFFRLKVKGIYLLYFRVLRVGFLFFNIFNCIFILGMIFFYKFIGLDMFFMLVVLVISYMYVKLSDFECEEMSIY